MKDKEFFRAMPNVENHSITLGIILKKTNEFIGWCFACQNRDLPNCNTEIAYAISKYHRNKGYTTQATKALIKYLFKETTMDTLSALALKNNASSNRVIQKCGFKFVESIDIGKCELTGTNFVRKENVCNTTLENLKKINLIL
ncbi:GNAT family N-acetyltransferase [Clostridium algidicarnis]|uniref:GNAT family N-acetyltransferase n=1 Tax=Clostridium algidicarnis TaxID=37659 RepID=UPI0016270668|nr:GNAT family N-acetyltransferase [Clostridium algidicarnis]MBB6630139.1 GNAT family N-acetyltransferase [Clostridium algidicarnis]